MNSKKILILVAVVTAAASAGTVAIAGAVGAGAPDPRFDRVSNAGALVAQDGISDYDRLTLTSGGARPELVQLARRSKVAFFTAPGTTGGTCHGIGVAPTGQLAALTCPSPGGSVDGGFPSASHPILDFTPRAHDVQNHVAEVAMLAGFAADGVAKVVLVGTDGTLHAAPVRDNVYERVFPNHVRASALIAVDSTGREVFRRDY